MEFTLGMFFGSVFGFAFAVLWWIPRHGGLDQKCDRPIVPRPPDLDQRPHVYDDEGPNEEAPAYRVNGKKVDVFEFFGDDFTEGKAA